MLCRLLIVGGLILAAGQSAGQALDSLSESVPPNILVLTGRQVPALQGTSPSALRAFAVTGGTRVPLPVQVDERWSTPTGTAFAYETGDEPSRDPDPSFDNDDLLLLPANIPGDRLPPAQRQGVVEIEVQNHAQPAAGGWLYVVADATEPLPAPWLSYDDKTDAVRGRGYSLASKPERVAIVGDLRLGDHPGRSPNLIDRSKARLDLDLSLGLGRVRRTEEDVRARTTALHIGPLRIVREVEVRGRVVLGIYSRPLRERFVYYPDGFSIPTTVWIPPRYGTFLSGVSLRLTMDLDTNAEGMTFLSYPELPTALPIDGSHGVRGGQQPLQWYLLRHQNTGLLGWLTAAPEVLADVTLFYDDDAANPDPPEDIPGQIGQHGFWYRHKGRLPGGPLRLITHAWILQGSDLADPAAARRRFEQRPTVLVH